MDATIELALWRLKRTVRSMGWPAVGAIALAAFAAGLFVSSVMPLQAEIAALKERVRQLEAPAAGERATPAQAQDPSAQLAAFYGRLPPARQAPEVVRRLHALARQVGLALERGEYRPLPDPSARLVRYQILFPVRGTYPQIKDFLARALRAMPALALEGVGFQRDDDSQALEAQLRFMVFLRADE